MGTSTLGGVFFSDEAMLGTESSGSIVVVVSLLLLRFQVWRAGRDDAELWLLKQTPRTLIFK
jgi:hypothetical protein